jgi:hypothetical protein
MRLPILFLAAASSAQVAPAATPKPWIAMVDAQVGREAKINHAGELDGTYRRSRSGFELIHEGPNHALDLEFYSYQHKMSGPLATDDERAYSDTDDLILSGFVQSELATGNHLQLIGAVEWAAASELDQATGQMKSGLGAGIAGITKDFSIGDLRATESKAYTPCRFGNHIDAKTILRAKHLSAFLRVGSRFRQREASLEHAALYPIE